MSASLEIVATETTSWGEVRYSAPIVRREPGKTEIEFDVIHVSSSGGVDWHGWELLRLERTEGGVTFTGRGEIVTIPAHICQLVADELGNLAASAS